MFYLKIDFHHPKYVLSTWKRNGETNTFPWSDWPGDGSVQYQGNIHWDSILHGGIHSEYTVKDHHKYFMKQHQRDIHWDSILHGGIHSE